MKTIEEKARAYDEVLNKLRHFIAKGVDPLITRADVQDFFPELAESEGEKIKKRITLCLEECVHSDVIRDYEKDECIAWLEKQGSKDKFIEKELGCIKGYREKAIKRLEELEEQGEQKPQRMISAEAKEAMYDKPAWSEEDVRVIDDIFYSINEESVIEGLNDRGIMYALKDIRGIVRYLRNWLQDLKDRVQPQPKQDWSEKDGVLLESISVLQNTGHWVLADKLKSIRHQSRWKPSELQLECLSDAIEYYNSSGYPATKLKELYEQLKKL